MSLKTRLKGIASDLDAHSFTINDGYVSDMAKELDRIADELTDDE